MKTIINTRNDLDSIKGTDEYEAFISLLSGSMWRLERDDVAKTWYIIEDNSTIERFGFKREDFPNINPPQLPEYIEEVLPVPNYVTRRQGRLALIDVGLLEDVESLINNISDQSEKLKARVEYEADTWERNNAFLVTMWKNLGGTDDSLDDLFRVASEK